MAKQIVFNSADYKFIYFTDNIGNISEEHHGEDWYIKLRELDAKIHRENLKDKINFSDDRLVLIAYKVMAETDAYTAKASLREWWIVQRYLDIYATKDVAMINELRKCVNEHIGFTFSDAEMSEQQEKDFKALCKSLEKVVFKDGYLKLPQFVLDVIENGERVEYETEETEQEAFTGDEREQWEGLKSTAEMMLSDEESLTKKEIENWRGALETANMMLEQ